MNLLLKKTLIVLLGAILLLASAYINGYPIVYSDTSNYIDSGFMLETPIDRPITYGLFLRAASLNGISLWFVILTQAILVSFLIYELLKLSLSKRSSRPVVFLSIISFLSIFTSASWTTSQLISDIFTPIMLLAIIILVIGRSGISKTLVLYFIFFLATATHLSHISFNVLLIGAVLILRKINLFGMKDFINQKSLLICLGLSLMCIATMGSAISKSKHGFLMGALVEHGIVKKYLDDNCPQKNYKLCAYKDELPSKPLEINFQNSK